MSGMIIVTWWLSLLGDGDPMGGGHYQEAVHVISGHGLQHLLAEIGLVHGLKAHIHNTMGHNDTNF